MKTIVLTNQKGGVGKTTSSSEFAYLFAKKGYKVILISFDQQGDLELQLNIGDKKKYSLLDCMQAKCRIDEAVIHLEHFDFLASDDDLSQADKLFPDTVDAFLFNDVIEWLEENLKYDFAIVDTAPSRSTLHRMALMAADYVLIPVDSSPGSLKGISKIKEDIDLLKKRKMSHAVVLGTYMTSTRKTNLSKGIENQLEQLSTANGIVKFENSIRQTTCVGECKQFKLALNEYGSQNNAAFDYRRLTNEILKRIEEFQLKEGRIK